MSADAWITLVVLAGTFMVLASGRMPTAAAMAAAVGVLMFTGVITQAQALSGLSSSAPITVGALYVLAGAATLTGALSPAIDRVLDGRRDGSGGVTGGRGGGRSGDRARLLRLTSSTMAMSAVLPNTPLVALVAPRVVTWSRRAGVSPSVYLMPLSFAAVLGGVITVIGTSTNLVISDLLVAAGDEPLGIFEVTPIGLPVALVGLVVLSLTAPFLLRSREAADRSPSETADRYTVAMRVDTDGPLVGVTVEDAGLRQLQGVYLASVERGGQLVTARPETRLGDGDTCYFVGDVNDVVDLFEVDGLTTAEHPHLAGAADRPDASLYETVVSERSDLAGSTLREVGFRSRYDAAVLAIRHHGEQVPGKLGSVTIRAGDVLLVLATSEFGRQWRNLGDFSVVAALDAPPPPRRHRGWMVMLAIVAMVTLAVTGALDLMEAALLAAASLLAFRVISPTEARRSVNLNVVLTMAMAIGLGAAVATSGLAVEVADVLGRVGEPFGAAGAVLAVMATTMVLTELLSNNAAAALMLPVALAAAPGAGIDPRTMAIVVLVGASCSFLSPIGYQTNLMVYSLGGYRFGDFARLGAPISLAALVVVPVVVTVWG